LLLWDINQSNNEGAPACINRFDEKETGNRLFPRHDIAFKAGYNLSGPAEYDQKRYNSRIEPAMGKTVSASSAMGTGFPRYTFHTKFVRKQPLRCITAITMRQPVDS